MTDGTPPRVKQNAATERDETTATPPTTSAPTRVNNIAESKPFYLFPARTSRETALEQFKEKILTERGKQSSKCDCPNLDPIGLVVAVEFTSEESYRDLGSQVACGILTQFHCACPQVEPVVEAAEQRSYTNFKNSLRRLKRNCAEGKPVYCASFTTYLQRFREACTSTFATEATCAAEADALENTSTSAVIRLAEGVENHRVSFNMPCDTDSIPSCEKCVAFQLLHNDFVESIARRRCQDDGFPILLSYRKLSCEEATGGPNPFYEATCSRQTGTPTPYPTVDSWRLPKSDRYPASRRSAQDRPRNRRSPDRSSSSNKAKECCFIHHPRILSPNLYPGYPIQEYEGMCCVNPAGEETCDSILSYLNNPMSSGKNYCQSTSVRGNWETTAPR